VPYAVTYRPSQGDALDVMDPWKSQLTILSSTRYYSSQTALFEAKWPML